MKWCDQSLVESSACLGADQLPLTETVQAAGGIWFSAEASLLEQGDDGQIAALRTRSGDQIARPAKGNNAKAEVIQHNGTDLLCFPARQNAGFVSEPVRASRQVSLAVLWLQGANTAETLCALCCESGEPETTLLLRESRDVLSLTNRAGDPTVDLPLSHGKKRRLAYVVFDPNGGRFCFAGGRVRVLSWPDAFSAGEFKLLIACRRDKGGLFKTQGAARIADILMFPDGDILSSSYAPLRRRLEAYAQQVLPDGI